MTEIAYFFYGGAEVRFGRWMWGFVGLGVIVRSGGWGRRRAGEVFVGSLRGRRIDRF